MAHPENESTGAEPQIQCATPEVEGMADWTNDVDDYISACLPKASACDYDRIETARKLTFHGKGEEALKCLDGVRDPTYKLWANYYFRARVDALLASGDRDGAQAERIKWLRYEPTLRLYEEIIDNAADDDAKQKLRAEAIEIAIKYNNVYIGMNFLVELDEFGQCAELIYAKLESEIDGSNYQELRPAINTLRNVEPLAAVLLSRKILERILNKQLSQYYRFAARDLVNCANFSKKITNFRGYMGHDEYFAKIKATYGRQYAFWKKFKEINRTGRD
ncbi:MAG: hypothetical protein LBB26_03850 [Puniceicoccales bacterium]|jgi:hypothetical protein|nr:hypothetical protein [Puniceicoccales bacterium]